MECSYLYDGDRARLGDLEGTASHMGCTFGWEFATVGELWDGSVNSRVRAVYVPLGWSARECAKMRDESGEIWCSAAFLGSFFLQQVLFQHDDSSSSAEPVCISSKLLESISFVKFNKALASETVFVQKIT